MLSASGDVAYIPEPFNLLHDPGQCGAKFKYWFTYICSENASDYEPFLRDTVHLHYSLKAKLDSLYGFLTISSWITEAASFELKRWQKKRPLLKDPLAVLSADWLASRFGMDVVITIRHPAAFAESLKSRNWAHPFSHFVAQPERMRDVLFPFEAEIYDFAKKEHDIIDQAALLWKIVYHTVDVYRQKHPEWIFVRHEDLARDPVQNYRSLCQRLNLKFTSDVQSTIEAHSTKPSADKTETELPSNNIRRNSKALIHKWKTRLTCDEISRVRAKVGEASDKFYSQDDW